MVLKKIVVCVVLLAAAHVYAQPVRGGGAVVIESKPVVERSMNEEPQSDNDQSSGKGPSSLFRIFGGVAFPIGGFAKK